MRSRVNRSQHMLSKGLLVNWNITTSKRLESDKPPKELVSPEPWPLIVRNLTALLHLRMHVSATVHEHCKRN